MAEGASGRGPPPAWGFVLAPAPVTATPLPPGLVPTPAPMAVPMPGSMPVLAAVLPEPSGSKAAASNAPTLEARRVTARTVLDKVLWAIDFLADPGGASRPAIAKCVASTFGETSPLLLKKALSAGVKIGRLVQTGQRFALSDVQLVPRTGTIVRKTILKEGTGAVAKMGDKVDVKYVGTLASDGSEFDRSAHIHFTLGEGEVIKGWDREGGILGMRVGERARLEVPPSLGYGKRGAGPEIPPDATLIFEVTLNKITCAAEP